MVFVRTAAAMEGYVTNLSLRLASQAVADKPPVALVDINNFRRRGFFQEASIRNIRAGNWAIMTMMAYPGKPI
jgi:multidrug resistance efflux pump